MNDNNLRNLYQEKLTLLDKWTEAQGKEKMKILIRLIDIDDQISEFDAQVKVNQLKKKLAR